MLPTDGLVTQVTPVRDLRQWENGGYFVLRPEIFDYINEGEDLVEDALPRLVSQRRVLAYPYKGYWSPADTVKERARLDEMYYRGNCPWMVWDPERSGAAGIRAGTSPMPLWPNRRPLGWLGSRSCCRCNCEQRPAPRCRCWSSARTPTTSRSGQAGCCSNSPGSSLASATCC